MLLSRIAPFGARRRIDLLHHNQHNQQASAAPRQTRFDGETVFQTTASSPRRRCDLSWRGRCANFAQFRDATRIMILTCPSCRTRYQTDPARIVAPGRNVRCAKCGEVWFQAAPGLDPELEHEPGITAPVAPGHDASAVPVSDAASSDASSVSF